MVDLVRVSHARRPRATRHADPRPGTRPGTRDASPTATLTRGHPGKVSYRLWLDDSCISGKGPASTRLVFDLRKPTGKLVDSLPATTDGTGAFDGCFPDETVQTGLKLIARKKSTVLRTITLPRLTVKTDRVTDKVIVGTTLGRKIALTVFDCNSSFSGCTVAGTRTGTIGDKGTWTTDLTTAYDARGHDPVDATFKLNGDTIGRDVRFPYLAVGDATHLYGSATPGSTVRIRLKDAPGGTLLRAITRTADANGRYAGTATLTPGRELSADIASDAKITIPTTSLTYNAADDAFEGTCLPDGLMAVYWYDGGQMVHGTATADSLGAWVIDLDAVPVVTPAAETNLSVTCNTPAGDQVVFDSVMPS